MVIGNRLNGLVAKEATQQQGKCQVLNLTLLPKSLTEDSNFSETKITKIKEMWGGIGYSGFISRKVFVFWLIHNCKTSNPKMFGLHGKINNKGGRKQLEGGQSLAIAPSGLYK